MLNFAVTAEQRGEHHRGSRVRGGGDRTVEAGKGEGKKFLESSSLIM